MHVNESEELMEVDHLLHDLSFDMSNISFDAQNAVLEILLYRSQKTRDFFPSILHSGPRNSAYVLKISNVMSYDVKDPLGLTEHSYSRLHWTKPSSLSLISNFPGSIDLEVSLLNVCVEEQPEL